MACARIGSGLRIWKSFRSTSAVARCSCRAWPSLQPASQSLSTRSFGTSELRNQVRKFTEKHEWVLIDGKIGIVGISHYAQDALGDVVYAQLPDVGSEFSLMDECGALESVKAASELCCPVSGKVLEKNSKVEDSPALVNQSCYDEGWLFKLELTNPEELKDLMDEKTYEKFLKSQENE